ncbi:glycosyl transferase family 1 [Geodermatophilus normandii]|uniref:Glycosyl transferase family 1 n=1 Tax=Geodermatophilus normandii TaxID=1137989 RepID=A0A317QCI4_9ACTN|nr:glycosyltransferase [Geodermatophilus normandii]PWW21378.1 glycosyl transferase family 1 [Geodermatophilus normandii]
MYRHVDLLNAAGLPAAVLHQRPGFHCRWFPNDTVVTDVRATAVSPSDTLVIPEIYVSPLLKALDGVRHVVFNQGAHMTWSQDGDAVGHHLADSPDLFGLVCVSRYDEELLKYAFPDVAVQRVRHSIEPAVFRLPDGASDPRPRRMSYMPRRAGDDASAVLRLLRSRGVLDGWEVLPLHGLTTTEVAEALRRTMVFMAFTGREGFGLPAAEAMACGAYVVGNHGYGGRELFDPDFSTTVDSGDLLGFARAVEHIVMQEAAAPGWCGERGRAAAAFITREYSPAHERENVVTAYTSLLQLEGKHTEDGRRTSAPTEIAWWPRQPL